MSDKEQTEKLEKVLRSLSKVNPDTHKMVLGLAEQLTELQIIQAFNQFSLDLFQTITAMVNEMGWEREIKFTGYSLLLENALKINVKLPIDNFTWFVLEYAPKIYSQEEDFFMNKHYNAAKVGVGHEFSFVTSEPFKAKWKLLNKEQKETIKDKFIMVTIYAHVYFFKVILINKHW